MFRKNSKLNFSHYLKYQTVWIRNTWPNEDVVGPVQYYSEFQILEEYYNYWAGAMGERFGVGWPFKLFDGISDKLMRACIDDWVVSNWAWRAKDSDPLQFVTLWPHEHILPGQRSIQRSSDACGQAHTKDAA